MIEQMSHVAVMCKAIDKDTLLSWLYGERGFHPMPIDEQNESWTKSFAALPDDTQSIDARHTRLSSVVGFCQEHCANKPNFLDAMLPLKVIGTKKEIAQAVEEVNIDELYDETGALRNAIELSNEVVARLQAQKASVEQFAFLGDDLPKLRRLDNVLFEVVAVSGQGGKAFLLDERITSGQIVAEQFFADQTHTYYALVAAVSDADVLKALVDDHGLHVTPLPDVENGAKKEIMLLNNRILDANGVLERQKEDAATFADSWLRKTSLATGHYESEKNLALARIGMSESDNLFVTRGYIKTDRLSTFKRKLDDQLSGATILSCDAPEGEEPPISLKWNKWISPASLLVKMYGLPTYNSIDPTFHVATIFFVFVGICLGDAVYGIGLILAMMWLKKRYKDQAQLQDFFQCFAYCGVTGIIVGILTGSFLGDLSAKIPGMEWFDRIRTTLAVIDPVKDSQTALYIAVGIGVFTQFYGMALRVYRDWRRGDRMGAFSDGILWICFLAFVLLAAATGSAFFWFLFILTIIGLVLTQGRDQRGWAGRIFVGAIAIYGIMGAYGASAILGDLISYARLMALGLTSAALGSTFNMLADLSVSIPAVGVIVAILVVVLGHLGNFFLGLLGGFVHSARLVMLEFFGRFYDAGGSPYRPYGFDSTLVGVKKEQRQK